MHSTQKPSPKAKKGGADGLTQPPFLITKRKTRVKCHTIIQQEEAGSEKRVGHARRSLHAPVNTFEFYRFRFHFQAVDEVKFPAGTSANTLRGALGTVLRETASPELYRRIFEPGGGMSPSGLTDWPRPFIVRPHNLDGASIPAGGGFWFDIHVFEVRE